MKIEIQHIAKSHFKEILDLANTSFGNDYIRKEQLEQYLKSTSHFGYVVIFETELVGFMLNQIIKSFQYKVLQSKINVFEIAKQNEIGVIKSLAIKENYQGKGIASQLIEKALHELEKTMTHNICIVWDHPENRITNVLKKFGFSHIETIPQYWKDESLEINYQCKICGSPPCLCTAQIWMK